MIGADDLISMIDDQLVTIQTHGTSSCIRPSKEKATEKHKTLRDFHAKPDASSHAQASSRSSSRSRLWKSVDKSWTDIMNSRTTRTSMYINTITVDEDMMITAINDDGLETVQLKTGSTPLLVSHHQARGHVSISSTESTSKFFQSLHNRSEQSSTLFHQVWRCSSSMHST